MRADLLLHVVDAASSARDDQVAEVNKVLVEIGADSVPQVMVFNKIDATALQPGVDRDEYGKIATVRISAKTGAGPSEANNKPPAIGPKARAML